MTSKLMFFCAPEEVIPYIAGLLRNPFFNQQANVNKSYVEEESGTVGLYYIELLMRKGKCEQQPVAFHRCVIWV